jgi:RHS repeat-associated protein
MNLDFQPRHFTTYERDTVGGMDEAMARRYHGWWSRFSQPDPYDGSYSLTDPQSFNRYAYTQNDPVNFVDPTGAHVVFRVMVRRRKWRLWRGCRLGWRRQWILGWRQGFSKSAIACRPRCHRGSGAEL